MLAHKNTRKVMKILQDRNDFKGAVMVNLTREDENEQSIILAKINPKLYTSVN